MVTYIIASKASSPFLTECQLLGEFLAKNMPDVTIEMVIKSDQDWPKYVNAVSTIFRSLSCFNFRSGGHLDSIRDLALVSTHLKET